MQVISLKRILVPTDFSEPSAAAVKYGAAFARAFNAELHLMHVAVRYELDVMVERQRVIELFLADAAVEGGNGDPAAAAQHAARDLLAPMLGEQEQRELRVEYVLRAAGAGGPYLEIVRYASQNDVDLIVMGTRGRGVVAHALVGSVAERVVRKAPCPVLTIHHPEHEFVLPDEVELEKGV
jgi:nucleotide-binding universal stress UspA family protein